MMNLVLWMIVINKGVPLTNINSADNMTDWYLYMRCLGMFMYVEHNWLGLDRTLFTRKESLSLPKISSSVFASARDIGQSIISLFAIYHL